MKGLIGTLAILMAIGSTKVQCKDDLPFICKDCECLTHTRPFDVDCRNMERHTVPDLSLNNITYPWILNLGNNLIHEVPKISKQENLLSINFKNNRISSISDGAFENLPSLKELYFQRNNLTEDSLSRETFKGLYNRSLPEPLGLEVLDLSYNYIKSLNSHTFVHLKSLKRLFLAHNPLKDISYNTAFTINELTDLRELDLSQTGIDRLPAHFLSDLRNLQVLTLAGNKFNTVPGEINYAHNLRHLNLNANPILSLTLGDFRESLKTLKVLDISAMQDLRNVGPHTFSHLKSLEKLSMSSCPQLSVIDPFAFHVLEGNELRLQEIHIQDNHLITISEEMLPWLSLQLVDIQNNPWQCDCHLRWVAEKLIPDLEKKNPESTLSILCAEPVKNRGMRVTDLLGRSHTFECNRPGDGSSSSNQQALFGSLSLSIIIVGTLLLFTGSMFFAYVLFRKSQSRHMYGETVKYRRAENDDAESVQS